jgi:hydrogenase expression/formation protein HypD
MRYVDEFRDAARVNAVAAALRTATTSPWVVMEVCGGQTHAFARFGLDALLPDGVELVHGPGCPVCVTPEATVETARRLALDHGVVLATYADMLRVPGLSGDLLSARAAGGEVRTVNSPLDALALARAAPDREVVFFGVGFETTAPATAVAVLQAERLGVSRFSILASHVRVPPAIDALLRAPDVRVRAFLAAGHVCTVAGTAEYEPLARKHRVPIVVTGFEPLDLLDGLLRAIRQLEAGRAELEVQYTRAVRPDGNPEARAAIAEVFEVGDVPWRGLGVLPEGGFVLRERYAHRDALRRFGPVRLPQVAHDTGCRAADVLRGVMRPDRCPEFGRGCTPASPLGAPMVSSEGACAAYHRFRRGAAERRLGSPHTRPTGGDAAAEEASRDDGRAGADAGR